MSLATPLVLRRNTDGTIECLPLPEAVSVLSALLSAETYESRLSIAAALTMGKKITANGCEYKIEPARRRKVNR